MYIYIYISLYSKGGKGGHGGHGGEGGSGGFFMTHWLFRGSGRHPKFFRRERRARRQRRRWGTWRGKGG